MTDLLQRDNRIIDQDLQDFAYSFTVMTAMATTDQQTTHMTYPKRSLSVFLRLSYWMHILGRTMDNWVHLMDDCWMEYRDI